MAFCSSTMRGSMVTWLFLVVMTIGLVEARVFIRPKGSSQMPRQIAAVKNDRPIVAVLSLPAFNHSVLKGATSYFPASYVKWLEASGARVAPLVFDWDDDRFDAVLESSSGVLLTGGAAELTPDHPYFRRVERIVHYVLSRNAISDFYPLWGTCLGFESLLTALSRDYTLLTDADANNISLPVNFTQAATISSMFHRSNFGSRRAMNILSKRPVTFNEHSKRVSSSDFMTQPLLASLVRILATNVDRQGNEFVSIVEGAGIPLFATQFHPEKNIFEWDEDLAISHSPEARFVSQYLGDFFVDQTRRTSQEHHRFESIEEEDAALIYNYNPVYSGKSNPYFQQIYLFEAKLRAEL